MSTVGKRNLVKSHWTSVSIKKRRKYVFWEGEKHPMKRMKEILSSAHNPEETGVYKRTEEDGDVESPERQSKD